MRLVGYLFIHMVLYLTVSLLLGRDALPMVHVRVISQDLDICLYHQVLL